MKLEYKAIESFEVCGIIFNCVSKWNGLEEWRDSDGQKMIVSRDRGSPIAAVFAEIFTDGPQPGQLAVVSASPRLIDQLKLNDVKKARDIPRQPAPDITSVTA